MVRGRTMMKRFFALGSILIMTFFLCSCVDQSGGKDTSSKYGENAKLVATSPATAEICSKLKLNLVGVSDTNSTLPEEYKELPKVGMAMSPDLEKLKTLKPDCVLSPISLSSDLKPKYEAAKLGYKFIDFNSVDGMFKSIKELGKEFDREKEAESLIKEHDKFMEEYKAKFKDKPKPKVLILMGLPGSYVIATENSYIGSLVKMAGGENVYHDDKKDFLSVNTEDMKTKNPDVILRAAHAMPDKVKDMFAKEFSENDIWKHFSAVEKGKVYDLDPEYFNMSARLNYIESLEQLEGFLYK